MISLCGSLGDLKGSRKKVRRHAPTYKALEYVLTCSLISRPTSTESRQSTIVLQRKQLTSSATMRCCWLPLLLFAAVGLAEQVGEWTLHNFQLFCDPEGATCVYTFAISQDTGSTAGDQCLFTVDGKDGKLANQTDFQALNCLGNGQYKINGGWSQEGFVTIVVTDTDEDLYAFFAYSSDTIKEGMTVNEQTRPAYRVGTFDMSSDTVVPAKRSGPEWQVLNLQQGRRMEPLARNVRCGLTNICRLQRSLREQRADLRNPSCVRVAGPVHHHH